MNWQNWLATLLITLALAACAQGGQVPYSPEYMHDRGGGGGGGGGGGISRKGPTSINVTHSKCRSEKTSKDRIGHSLGTVELH
jgi:hypothetical protein